MTGTAELAGAIALLLSLALLCVERITAAAKICAVQALLCAVVLGAVRPASAAIAVFAFILNGVALPFGLSRVLDRRALAPLRDTTALLWLAAVAILAVTAAGLARLGVGNLPAIGASIVLLSLLLLLRASDDVARFLGLWSAQNGILIAANAAPAATVIIVALPVVPALVLTNAWLHR